MLVIKDKQLEAFKKLEMTKFVEKSKLFLQQNFENWYQNKEENAIDSFINQTVEFGLEMNIRKQINLQKLMFLQIEYQLNLPLSGELEKIMSEKDVLENKRLTNLFKNLDLLRNRN